MFGRAALTRDAFTRSGTRMQSLAPPPHVQGVGRALPPHYADQETLIASLRDLWASQHFNVERLEELHRAVQVSGRHLALPLEAYPGLTSFAARNDAWIRVAQEVGADALTQALAAAGLAPQDVDHL